MCYWGKGIVAKILSRVDYLGHTVSERTFHKSYRDKRSFKAPKEKWIITENTHERIVDPDTWERVQRLRESTKRKQTPLGDMGPLNGILFCADCGRRLRIQRDIKTTSEYFICQTYAKSRTGFRECSIHSTPRHYIEPLILDDIQHITAFAREREAEFVSHVEKTHEKTTNLELRAARIELDKAERRINELDLIIKRIYEDSVTGRLSSERFDKMYADYEAEQENLRKRADELNRLMEAEQEKNTGITRFLNMVKKYTDVSELTAEIVRVFIDRIVVHQAEGRGNARAQEIDVYYNFIGLVKK
jgi:hypothetical protein